MNDDLYQANIIDHYQHPRHYGHLENPDIVYHDVNPNCGDEITIELKIEDDVIREASFTGHGCSISQASASMMMEEIQGKPLAELRGWGKEEILDLLGVKIGPVRMKCALLPLKTLKAGVWGPSNWDGEDADDM